MEYVVCETDIYLEETLEPVKTYGVVLLSDRKEILRVSDVSPTKDDVKFLIGLLNKCRVSAIHAREIISDFVGNENFFEKSFKNM